jgi:hypothetical protein
LIEGAINLLGDTADRVTLSLRRRRDLVSSHLPATFPTTTTLYFFHLSFAFNLVLFA